MLTPEEPENRIAEFMRSSVDWAVTGSLSENLADLEFSPSKQMWLLRQIARFVGFVDKVGDGLVDAVSDPFVGDEQSLVRLEKADHFALLAEASSADACLQHLGKKRAPSFNPLEIIAYGASLINCLL